MAFLCASDLGRLSFGIGTVLCIAVFSALPVLGQDASGIVSDNFNTPELNTEIWKFVDPLNDGSISMTGTQLAISVPAGSEHDAWHTNTTARVMQAANDTDFEIEAKFDSPLEHYIQDQGILVEEDVDRFLRFDIYRGYSSVSLRAYSAFLDGPLIDIHIDNDVAQGAPMWMRVTRTGDLWTFRYSLDGSGWTTLIEFEQELTVTAIGPYAGNFPLDQSPAHTALVDYFVNTASPPDDDGGQRPHLAYYWLTHQDIWPVDHISIAGRSLQTPAIVKLLSYVGLNVPTHVARQVAATKLNLASGVPNSIQGLIEYAEDYLILYPPGTSLWWNRQAIENGIKLSVLLLAYNGSFYDGSTLSASKAATDFRSQDFASLFRLADEPRLVEMSSEIKVEPAYPNPFNPTTTIRFHLPSQGLVRAEIFDMVGRRVLVLAEETLSMGTHALTVDAQGLTSGAYLYRIVSPFGIATGQLHLVK